MMGVSWYKVMLRSGGTAKCGSQIQTETPAARTPLTSFPTSIDHGNQMKIMKYFSFALASLLITPLLTAQAKQSADLLITGGTVVAMDAPRSIIENGAVALTGDTIVDVGPRADIEAKY